jgi:orotidine-5'-phosphate decarboxylase
MLQIPARDRLIVALDVPTVDEAQTMVDRLGDSVAFYKVGLQLLFAGGLAFAEGLAKSGKRVFLDVKLLDIDNTVEGAIRSIVPMGVSFATVHAYPKAMRAAIKAKGSAPLKLLAVTVLTSMDDADVAAAGYTGSAADLVLRRARQALEAGMDGIVASPAEAAAVRAIIGMDVAIVTPGVRPAGTAAGDQQRIATPGAAIRAGADYLVVGRPITAAGEPKAAAGAIVAEIESTIAALAGER